MGPAKLLLGVSASIAAYKACEIIRRVQDEGIEVRCVLSRDAGRFITPLTLQSLSGRAVHSDMFAPREKTNLEHISLADEADCILIAPATADVISRIAAGICDDLLTTVVCAAAVAKPVVIAPAMNAGMYKNPVIQDKITYLAQKGYHFIGPVEGELACGSSGKGRMAAVSDIVAGTLRHLGR